MDSININGSFIPGKISKIRWVPEQYSNVHQFLTGSWNSVDNHIRFWKLVGNEYSDDNSDYVPECYDEALVSGDITGLEFLDSASVVVSTSKGYISIFDVNRNSEKHLSERKRSEVIHKFQSNEIAPCTGISVFDKDIVTVGEDGRLNILSSNGLSTIRQINSADSSTPTCVCCISHNEVLIGNIMGMIKMFDIRSNQDDPTGTFLISCEDDRKSNSVTCLCYHPMQKHIVLVGSEEGSITVWDLRQPNFPSSYLSAHTNTITEIGFHKTQPKKLFTASENGELWLWDQNTMTVAREMHNQMNVLDVESNNPWLNGERAKTKINVTSLITDIRKSINSFDVQEAKVICGCDSEEIFHIDNLF